LFRISGKKKKKNHVGLKVGLTLFIKKNCFFRLGEKKKKITKIMRVWTPKPIYEIIFTFSGKK
jgi:hypothetical protein